jgi:L-cystine transport system permease protein
MGVSMDLDFSFILVTLKAALGAVPLTLRLSLSSFALSLVIGSFFAIIRVYRVRFAARLLQIFVDVIKAVPEILILLILYYAILDGISYVGEKFSLGISSRDVSVNTVAIIVLTFFGSVIISETIRGSFLSIGKGQYEGAYSVGLSSWQALRRIILPQVIPTAVPILCNNMIIFIKASSVMYFISVMDILNAALVPATMNYRYLEAYISAALVYWAISLIIEQAAKLLEKRLSRFRRELA